VHLERELKFRIESEVEARRLERALPLVGRLRRQQLHNVYFDTEDLRLQRTGAALRLRRIGGKWLQTLKAMQGVQGALAARAEWEMPIASGTLDCGLFPREEVRAATGLDMLRLAPRLKPLFTTRFERRAGELALGHGVRAKACIDRGTVEAGRTRERLLELELELLDGELAPLLGLAETLADGFDLRLEGASKAERGYRLAGLAGPESPKKWTRPEIPQRAASDAFIALCSAALEQVAANAPGVARARDPEYLHQLRVGMRRLLSALRIFRPLLRRKRVDVLDSGLRQLMGVFGQARDWDVFEETLALTQADRGLMSRARRRRAVARRAAREAVESPEFRVAQLRALRWLHGALWRSDEARAESLAHFARRSLERAHAKLLKRAHHLDWRDAERRHSLRIAVKRLRYASDFFSACFPRQAVQPYLACLGALQDTLGELNDVAVGRNLLREVVQKEPDEAGLRAAAGKARHWLARRERELIAALENQWAVLEKRRPYWRPRQARRGRR
jgi:triphosphatase